MYELLTNDEGNARVPEAAEKAIYGLSGTGTASDQAHIHLDPLGTQGYPPAQPRALTRWAGCIRERKRTQGVRAGVNATSVRCVGRSGKHRPFHPK